eukprot:TRINITY_DN10270_c0_g3_i4.p2 TRINITY_DN10270_c0_g3~~TRINITY_DN10270_c0_g3_i4.p2  ORF type:complete len:209 (+),score=25.89 TRINITY_DN10270_c0_g3_i4:1728-2354(+)
MQWSNSPSEGGGKTKAVVTPSILGRWQRWRSELREFCLLCGTKVAKVKKTPWYPKEVDGLSPKVSQREAIAKREGGANSHLGPSDMSTFTPRRPEGSNRGLVSILVAKIAKPPWSFCDIANFAPFVVSVSRRKKFVQNGLVGQTTKAIETFVNYVRLSALSTNFSQTFNLQHKRIISLLTKIVLPQNPLGFHFALFLRISEAKGKMIK